MADGSRPVVLAVAVAAVAAMGCEDYGAGVVACDRPETPEPLLYTGGTLAGEVPNDCTYRSWKRHGDQVELLYFPGGAWYEIEHQLHGNPDWFVFYLSFERYLSIDPEEHLGGSVSLAAGNQAEIKAFSDKSITVLNGSCADYWLLAVVGKSPCAREDP